MKNIDQCFLKPKDIQFTVTEEETNWDIFTSNKLESESLDFYILKKKQKKRTQTNKLIVKRADSW